MNFVHNSWDVLLLCTGGYHMLVEKRSIMQTVVDKMVLYIMCTEYRLYEVYFRPMLYIHDFFFEKPCSV